ncbi:MAG: hypothetical protein GWO38_27625 [Phycisphaerae bacterium]|nr:hypothetical protein [Phycisphaerae bacterium]NIP55125.1 hypothetical protein [Phycisphaerae bacterium]NIX01533.1 hypothetical protein [Phycisphaerae bacterium]NIX31294.1 hypothetical protein [Phycisphaerae bacterium]
MVFKESLRVLMIEDNPGDARIIQDMLSDNENIEFAIPSWKAFCLFVPS